jgi:hypothetical protein
MQEPSFVLACCNLHCFARERAQSRLQLVGRWAVGSERESACSPADGGVEQRAERAPRFFSLRCQGALHVLEETLQKARYLHGAHELGRKMDPDARAPPLWQRVARQETERLGSGGVFQSELS